MSCQVSCLGLLVMVLVVLLIAVLVSITPEVIDWIEQALRGKQ
jgi:hypothetical protein